MKLRVCSSIFLLALSTTVLTTSVFATSVPTKPTTLNSPAKFYIGAFGGRGSSNSFNASQYGTAYFVEANGGPLSVNAFGQLNHKTTSFFGIQLGYQAPEILLNAAPQWTLGPAIELEGFSMSNNSFSGTLTNNTDVNRLPEHDFVVSYPMSRTVFLANGVFSINTPRLPVHPYVGFGIGSAIVRISGANSSQVNPLELGVNHYNTNTNDTSPVFSGQFKLGLSYDLNNYVSLFADYRWVYIASTHYIFGSTIAPGHAETSSWQVKLDAQKYNLGNIGIRFRI